MIPHAQPSEPFAASIKPIHADWPWWTRVAFRLSFLFWGIFCLQMGGVDLIFGLIPTAARWLNTILSAPTQYLAAWLGVHLFHLSRDIVQPHPTGSGDTALGYLEALATIILAVVGAAVWSAIAEARNKRCEYRTLYAWLRLAMRFVLAATLLGYGFAKVFPLQFPAPSLGTLTETYGESSPMRLLWTLMGASVPYSIFGGLAEVIPGLLLFFRRTSTLGALGSAAVMLNIVLLNFCYDVPVKLYSTELLLISLFLLLPDAMPMWRFFVLRRDSALKGAWVPRWERKPLRIAGYCLQIFVIGQLLYSNAYMGFREARTEATTPIVKPPIYGAWAVDSAAGEPAESHWIRFVVPDSQTISIYEQGGPRDYFQATYAGGPGHLQLNRDQRTSAAKKTADLHWDITPDGRLNLTGTLDGKPANISMHRLDASGFLLQTRGFNWVQEYPYNR